MIAEPTCTEDGQRTLYCSRCSETQNEPVYALGHDMVNHAAVAATCTAAGHTAYQKCSRCDYKTGYDEIPALGHDFVDHAAVAPTCTAAGHTAYEDCSRCDYIDGYTVIPASPATGHNFENGVCTICGHNYAQPSRCLRL